MSYPYDADRDDPRPVRLIEGDCVECSARGRYPAHGKCPACLELGQAPPPCPQCETNTLRGFQLVSWCYECSECDGRFSLKTLRTYALGLAVERIVKDLPTREEDAGKAITMDAFCGLIIRAARELKVIR